VHWRTYYEDSARCLERTIILKGHSHAVAALRSLPHIQHATSRRAPPLKAATPTFANIDACHNYINFVQWIWCVHCEYFVRSSHFCSHGNWLHNTWQQQWALKWTKWEWKTAIWRQGDHSTDSAGRSTGRKTGDGGR